ncbi:MAG: phosphoglycolate phosphatase [Alphaproteobacteria bacterium]|nr:phosphoglycolate phosphatase [Alphaproteobacteria bacterium]
MVKKYIIFDLDGTLINSIPDMCREISVFLNAHGRRGLTEAETVSVIGNGAPVLLKGAFALTGDPIKDDEMPALLAAWLDQYGKAEMAQTCPYPDVVETLKKLKKSGCYLAICTNKPHAPTEAILTKLDLKKHFDVILDADALPERKPRPEPLWEAVRRMGGTNDQAVMIGDSETDAQTARAAGIPVILLSYGYTHIPYEKIKPDALTDHFADLPEIIAAL